MQDQTNSIKGLDLSHYNTVNDWAQVKTYGAHFAYLKTTQGTGFIDPQYSNFVQGCKSIELPCGGYHYAALGDPAAEAKHFLDILNQHETELLPVLDLEEECSSIDYVQWVRTFGEALGQKFILYTGLWFINEHPELNQLTDIPIWISYYKETAPPDTDGFKQWTIWQYSDKAQIPGIADLVDVDYGVDLNHILKVVPPQPQPTIQDYVRGAIQSLNKKGYINSPQVWLDKLDKGEDLSDLAILLLDKGLK